MKYFIFLFLIFNINYPLQITEIFYKTGGYFCNDDRFIELFNETPVPFNLSNLVLVLPKDKNTYTNLKVCPGSFNLAQNWVITDSMIINPGQYAVILSEEYNKNDGLIVFSSNSLIVKPRNQAFTAYSWAGLIPFIKVTSSTGNDIFRCNQYYIPPDSLVDTNDSLSLTGNNYEITKPSAGINNECYIYSDKQIFHENEQTKIYCKNKECEDNVIYLKINFIFSGNQGLLPLTKDNQGNYSGIFIPPKGLPHGEDIIFSYGNNNFMLRYLDSRPISEFYRKILINEIVTDPKIDYSGGGWTGIPGPGKPGSSDDWLELINRTEEHDSNYKFLFDC